MIPEAYKEFIDKIIVKTDLGNAKWESDNEKSLFLRTKNATIEIGFYSDYDAEVSYYYFKYYNVITRKDSLFRVSSNETEYSTMEKLYSVASASASDIKDELSNFLSDL